MDLSYTDAARQNLREIVSYGLANGLGSAASLVDEMDQRLLTLTTQPLSGRKGRVPGTREWVLTPLPFIVVHRLVPDEKAPTEIQVLNIIHGAQQWPPSGSSTP